jgi:hypothetical protein
MKPTIGFYENVIDASQEVGVRRFVDWIKHHPDVSAADKVRINALLRSFVNEMGRGR